MEDNYEVIKDEDGTFYHKNGWPHREDGPAVELADGSVGWFINGQLHREDGPASILYDGTKR